MDQNSTQAQLAATRAAEAEANPPVLVVKTFFEDQSHYDKKGHFIQPDVLATRWLQQWHITGAQLRSVTPIFCNGLGGNWHELTITVEVPVTVAAAMEDRTILR